MIPTHIRQDFPIYADPENGEQVIYLDSAATSLKPRVVLDAMNAYYMQYSANIHRGLYPLSEHATVEYEQARAVVASFIGALSPEEIVFTRNTTEAINVCAHAFGEMNLDSQATIAATVLEHHSNFVPWQQLAHKKNIQYRVIPVSQEGRIDIAALSTYIHRSTKVFACSAVSNVLGVIQPISEIVQAVKKISPDCFIVVDAAQAVPHMKIDVQSWGADAIAFSGHKMCGPTGIGVLWVKKDILETFTPYQYGGGMISSVSVDKTTFAPLPDRFEAGTPAIAEAIGLAAAVRYLESLTMASIREHEKELTHYALQEMMKIPGIHIYGPVDVEKRAGVIPFTIDGIHPHDVAQILGDQNICVRAGHHCAMPLHEYLGLLGTTRISFYAYTTQADIQALIQGLYHVLDVFKK